ncbi:LysM peptidoglycan-binding domain-containing M23 family metallopeptidase [Bradyrhizobium sp. Leo121]|uniref:peptidoglycan DD-metalloendopeptidase family protein n=1 Tax=Bradyrhizobium sp. Leo121 TaxID=1571195 RepID=UPI0010291FE8|nr:LysM peptidoglycan-binding domain-containing M23 family metallopeptidase [Bradyrhizobium sp. Leo121]RZN31509.1 peptidoglycan-binding LysM [Bradyrhizobium sp. Leo121]
MSALVELLRSRRVPQVTVLALMSVGFAGCSGDMSTRFSQNSYSSNPFAFEPQATGSVPQQPVERRELPQYARPQSPYSQSQPYQSQPLPPPVAAPQSYPVSNSSVAGGGRGVASYAPPQQPPRLEAPQQQRLETTAAVPQSVARAPAGHGGTTIIVGTSDTLEVLSKRYNVSTAEILRANGYKGPRALSPGQQLVIPRPAAVAAAPAPAVAPPASKPVAVAATVGGVHYVNRGDTLHSIARQHHVSPAELAKANHLDQSARLSLGMKLTVPGAKTAAAAPTAPAVAPAPAAAPAAPAPKVVATAQPQSARLVQPAANVEQPAPAAEPVAVKPSETTSSLPTFRWPARGKVITGYGAKTNGKSNDGINLAVPEGTPVKAAEDGVVAYSGNELKGYGNLVLVRHSNGYVTAYAHASELLVKRGDTIKRGQVIAKSGQSGEVSSPQLHFEIRKGSSPVDPLQFLNGA